MLTPQLIWLARESVDMRRGIDTLTRIHHHCSGSDFRNSQDVAAIVIPKKVHQQISETYGGRNTSAQIELDSKNLRAALDHNLDAIKPALKEHRATESQIEAARSKMHKLNSDMGLYK
jgi:hypothetical protein